MKIIPVIDLKDGHVVHARFGERNNYQPIKTPLCPSPAMPDVIESFLNLHAFDTFYLADLNAIMGQGDHQDLIEQVAVKYENITFWLDNGCSVHEPKPFQPANIKTVIGSESQQEISAGDQHDFILSLDFQAEQKLGDAKIFDDPTCWPQNIIIMTLAKVGSETGPDFEKLNKYRRQFPEKNFIAAGGVRNLNDLQQLKMIGVDRALVASALHSGAITSKDIENL